MRILLDQLKEFVNRILFSDFQDPWSVIAEDRIRNSRLSKDPWILSTNSLVPYQCEKDKRKRETKVEPEVGVLTMHKPVVNTSV